MNLLYKIIYQPTINKALRNISFLFKKILPAKFQLHPAGVLRIFVDKDHGSFLLATNQTSYISKELFWEGTHHFEYTPVFIDLMKKVSVFFDIGANIGYYSILGSTINKKLTTHAFEPAMGARSYLTKNVQINNLSERILVIPSALMDEEGEIDFFEIRNKKYPAIYNLSGEHNIGTKTYKLSTKIRVEATTLDVYVRSKNIHRLDVIKLDTEGAESYILKGANNTIREFQPIIICELLFQRIEKELEAIMNTHDYLFYAHTTDGLRLLKTLVREEDDHVRNVFFVPKNKRTLLKEWMIE